MPGSSAVEIEHDLPAPAASTPSTGRRVLAILLLLVPALIILWCGWQRRWTADDGFINLRIVRQLVEGNGPVFNAGQRVEAGTSPAWIGLLAVLDLLTPLRLEWIAAISGLLATTAAVVVAVFGTRRGLLAIGVTGWFVPLGALAYVSLPAAWDFATSGLEIGLSLLWLAASWWLLCGRLRPDAPAIVPWYVPLFLGCGPIVRPDFVVFSVAFVVALAVLSPRRAALRLVAWALVVPVVAELARMAYFASLVPNTAMAKEASLSNWSQGWRYARDFAGNSWVAVPTVLLVVLAVMGLRGADRRGLRRFEVLAAAVAVGAALHALYVVKVGGDFMHARLLLPAWFALLLPASVVVVRGWAAAAAAAGVVVWSALAMTTLGPPYAGPPERPGVAGALEALDATKSIGDERLFYTRKSSSAHPVTIDDYLRHDPWAQSGAAVRRLAARESEPVLVLQGLAADPVVVPLRRGSAPRTVASAENLGLYAYAAGTGVDVLDDHGLADVLAGRLRLRERGRPGHEKTMPDVWTFARYAAIDAPLPAGVTPEQVVAARRALSCGELRRLLEHTDGSWTLGDVPSNMIEAFRSFRFRFDKDPLVAARELCGS